MKAICVCNTINPRVSFMFSLVWLSSAAFCDSIADIVQKLQTLLVRSTYFFPCPGSKRTRIRTQHSLHIAHERCQLYDKHPYWSCFSLVIAKLILTSACSWRDFFLMPPCWNHVINLNKFYAKEKKRQKNCLTLFFWWKLRGRFGTPAIRKSKNLPVKRFNHSTTKKF